MHYKFFFQNPSSLMKKLHTKVHLEYGSLFSCDFDFRQYVNNLLSIDPIFKWVTLTQTCNKSLIETRERTQGKWVIQYCI